MTNNDKVLGMIGMARRAGKVQTGAFLSERALQRGDAWLIIVAQDAADNVKKKFNNSCKYCEVDYMEYGTKELLGQFTGKEDIAVICVTTNNFATCIKDKYIAMYGDNETK